MSEYQYANDYERKHTQKYEGIYTQEQVELNQKLLDECDKKDIDFAIIEDLLKQGADPLGGTATHGWGVLNHVYGDIILNSKEDNNSINLPKITDLFLKYGMDVENPKIPYDDDNSINPLWDLGLAVNENSIIAFKMLLDKGISADSFGEFDSTAVGDLINLECGDPVNDEFWNYTCVWTLKMTMLAASYDYILNEGEYLKKFIGFSYNNYDIHKFRNWNDYYYKFDTSRCTRYPEFYKSVVTIYEVASNKEVWKFGVCLNEGEF